MYQAASRHKDAERALRPAEGMLCVQQFPYLYAHARPTAPAPIIETFLFLPLMCSWMGVSKRLFNTDAVSVSVEVMADGCEIKKGEEYGRTGRLRFVLSSFACRGVAVA